MLEEVSRMIGEISALYAGLEMIAKEQLLVQQQERNLMRNIVNSLAEEDQFKKTLEDLPQGDASILQRQKISAQLARVETKRRGLEQALHDYRQAHGLSLPSAELTDHIKELIAIRDAYEREMQENRGEK